MVLRLAASRWFFLPKDARDVGGHGGQHIELAMYDVGLAFNWVDVYQDYYFAGDGVHTVPAADPAVRSPQVVDPQGKVSQKILVPELFGLAETVPPQPPAASC